MCDWLSVSTSGYYDWRNRDTSKREQKKQLVEQAVILTFDAFKSRYGAPRMVVELNEAGIPCSLNHIAKIMADNGLKAKNGKNYKYFPSLNALSHVSDNLLARNFTADKPQLNRTSTISFTQPRSTNPKFSDFKIFTGF